MPSAVLISRFDQMFPILSQAEIDRVQAVRRGARFQAGRISLPGGEARRRGCTWSFPAASQLVTRDGLGQAVPVAAFAELIGSQCRRDGRGGPGRGDGRARSALGTRAVSVIDSQAVGEVEAIFVPAAGAPGDARHRGRARRAHPARAHPTSSRAHRARLRRSRARRDTQASPEVVHLSSFLGRNGIPFRVIDPDENPDAPTSLLERFAPGPVGSSRSSSSPTVRCSRTRPRPIWRGRWDWWPPACAPNPTTSSWSAPVRRDWQPRSMERPKDSPSSFSEALTFGGQAGASARIENYLGFPTGVSGQALMARAFTQAQKFGAQFSTLHRGHRARLRQSASSGP